MSYDSSNNRRGSIRKDQIIRLRTVASKLFQDDHQYHGWLGANYDVESTKDLSERQGNLAYHEIDRQLKLSSETEGSLPGFVGRKGFITLKQYKYMKAMFDELGWDTEKRQMGFIRKQLGLPKNVHKLPESLKKDEARKILFPLEKMTDRK